MSLDPPAPEPEKPLPSEKKKKPPRRAPRVLSDSGGCAQLQLSGQLYRRGAEGRADRAAGDPDVKAPTIKEIDEWLLAQRSSAWSVCRRRLLLRADPCRCGRRSAQRGQGQRPRHAVFSAAVYAGGAADGGGALYKTGLTTNRQVPAFAHGHGGMWHAALRSTFPVIRRRVPTPRRQFAASAANEFTRSFRQPARSFVNSLSYSSIADFLTRC